MSKRNRRRKRQVQPADSVLPASSALASTRTLVLTLVLGVSFLAFVNTLANSFAYDDQTQILQNEFIKDLQNVPTALVTEAWFWRVQQDQDPNEQDKPSTPYYRPIVIIYMMIGWELFGDWAAGWHLANVLLHLVVVYFTFLLLERVTSDSKLAALTSLLFAIHPLRSESIAWISGVTDVLLAFFMLPSLLLYMRYRESGRLTHLVGSLALFFAAVFTKEPAVCLPIFIICNELWGADQQKLFRDRLKTALQHGALFLAPTIIYFGMRQYSLGFLVNDVEFASYPRGHVLLTIPLVICKYIGLLLWPYELTLLHVTKLVTSPLSLRFVLPVLILAALGIGFWKLRRFRETRFAILWFVIHLLPVLNLSAFSVDFMVQERYVYVPSIGFSLLIAFGLLRIPVEKWIPIDNRLKARLVLAAFLILVLSGRTVAQNTVWKDDLTLWIHSAQVRSEEPVSHFVLGHRYLARRMNHKAIEELEAYMRLQPDNPVVWNNLAALHLVSYQEKAAINPSAADRAHLDRAIALCERGLNSSTPIPTLWDTLGTVYTYETSLKNYDRAVACFERGLAIQPGNAMMNFHMGATLAKQGKNEAAVRFLENARSLQPDLADVYKFLAYLYRDKGQLQMAVDHLSHYLKLQPDAFDGLSIKKEVDALNAQLKGTPPQG